MRVCALIRIQAAIVGRQRALWLTLIPLAFFATVLALISPQRPGSGGVEDLAFTGQILAIFSGIAYSAAFSGFFVSPARSGMQELEASASISPLLLRSTRVLGAFLVVTAPSAVVLVGMGIRQTLTGHLWSIPEACAVLVSVTGPAALVSMSLSGVAGALFPPAVGRIAAVLIWFYLVFSTPLLPIPTINGTPFTVIGDTIVAGYFATSPIYPPAGALGVVATPLSATASLAWQFIVILALLSAGTWVEQRARTR